MTGTVIDEQQSVTLTTQWQVGGVVVVVADVVAVDREYPVAPADDHIAFVLRRDDKVIDDRELRQLGRGGGGQQRGDIDTAGQPAVGDLIDGQRVRQANWREVDPLWTDSARAESGVHDGRPAAAMPVPRKVRNPRRVVWFMVGSRF